MAKRGPEHGRDEVVVIAAEEFRRLKGDLTGQALITAMQESPHRDIDIEPRGVPKPARDVALSRAGCWIPMFYLNCGRPGRAPPSGANTDLPVSY
jgi:hypothetical protein